jgi:hypothetical protein
MFNGPDLPSWNGTTFPNRARTLTNRRPRSRHDLFYSGPLDPDPTVAIQPTEPVPIHDLIVAVNLVINAQGLKRLGSNTHRGFTDQRPTTLLTSRPQTQLCRAPPRSRSRRCAMVRPPEAPISNTKGFYTYSRQQWVTKIVSYWGFGRR